MGVDQQILLEQTKQLRKELGPCLLVVKCYELLGDAQGEGRVLARDVVRGEIERLAEMDKRRYSGAVLAEQFLRAIYSVEIAGQHEQALNLFRTLRERTAKGAKSTGITELEALLMVTAQVIVGDRTLCDFVPAGTIVERLASAWATRTEEKLKNTVEELADLIASAEADGRIAPDQDGWLYILLRRLRNELGSIKAANSNG